MSLDIYSSKLRLLDKNSMKQSQNRQNLTIRLLVSLSNFLDISMTAKLFDVQTSTVTILYTCTEHNLT